MNLSLFNSVDDAIAGGISAAALSDDELVQACEMLNVAYRAKKALVSDARYDGEFLAELARRLPDHPFLQVPEPEPEDAFEGDRYRHTVSMLSTNKAYDEEAILSWTGKAKDAALRLGKDIDKLRIRITGKIDGIAGMRYPGALVTRGRNGFGTDVTRVLGLGVVGGEVIGPGELAVDQKFFDEVLRPEHGLLHPRNAVAGLIAADEMKPYHAAGLDAGMFRFVSYSEMEGIEMGVEEFEREWNTLIERATSGLPYLCDGAVAEFVDPDLRSELGSTDRFHRYMIAIKANEEFAETEITHMTVATGRTGRLVPVIKVKPVQMYGVTITSATAHTARHIDQLGLGVGAKVTLTRAGSIIPMIHSVTQRAEHPFDMSNCPSCGSKTEIEGGKDGAHRACFNTPLCAAQAARSLEHFFHTLAVCNGFGPATTEQLCKAGITLPSQVYAMDVAGFERAGISSGNAKNLIAELDRSRKEPIDERVFLAAFGIRYLGRGDSGALLKVIPLAQLGGITPEALETVHGFGPITSPAVAKSIREMWDVIQQVRGLGFNLIPEPSNEGTSGLLAGKTIVFTGTLESGSRTELKKQAVKLGATLSEKVGKTTTWLVCGTGVGKSKMVDAAKFGVRVLQESEYLAEIAH